MVRGGCLCGSVSFEIDGELTSIQYCHAVRCRKATGSAFAAELAARADTFRWVRGAELVTVYEAPLLREPPPYRHAFCRRCGSPLPVPLEGTEFLALHAGVLDGEPGTQAFRHIFVAQNPSWHTIADEMPRFEQHAPASQRLPRMASENQVEAVGQSAWRSSGATAHRPVVPETITTPRLVLRRPKTSDASAVHEYARDPEVTRFVDWPAHSDIGDALAATEAALRRWDSGEEYMWRITVKPDDTPVGAVGAASAVMPQNSASCSRAGTGATATRPKLLAQFWNGCRRRTPCIASGRRATSTMPPPRECSRRSGCLVRGCFGGGRSGPTSRLLDHATPSSTPGSARRSRQTTGGR